MLSYLENLKYLKNLEDVAFKSWTPLILSIFLIFKKNWS